MFVYEEGVKESIGKQFDDLLEIGLANAEVLKQHPIEWAQLHLKLLIDEKPERVKLWIKNVCDQQPMSKSTTPEGRHIAGSPSSSESHSMIAISVCLMSIPAGG